MTTTPTLRRSTRSRTTTRTMYDEEAGRYVLEDSSTTGSLHIQSHSPIPKEKKMMNSRMKECLFLPKKRRMTLRMMIPRWTVPRSCPRLRLLVLLQLRSIRIVTTKHKKEQVSGGNHGPKNNQQ